MVETPDLRVDPSARQTPLKREAHVMQTVSYSMAISMGGDPHQWTVCVMFASVMVRHAP
jgi:hypothetical protein